MQWLDFSRKNRHLLCAPVYLVLLSTLLATLTPETLFLVPPKVLEKELIKPYLLDPLSWFFRHHLGCPAGPLVASPQPRRSLGVQKNDGIKENFPSHSFSSEGSNIGCHWNLNGNGFFSRNSPPSHSYCSCDLELVPTHPKNETPNTDFSGWRTRITDRSPRCLMPLWILQEQVRRLLHIELVEKGEAANSAYASAVSSTVSLPLLLGASASMTPQADEDEKKEAKEGERNRADQLLPQKRISPSSLRDVYAANAGLGQSFPFYHPTVALFLLSDLLKPLTFGICPPGLSLSVTSWGDLTSKIPPQLYPCLWSVGIAPERFLQGFTEGVRLQPKVLSVHNFVPAASIYNVGSDLLQTECGVQAVCAVPLSSSPSSPDDSSSSVTRAFVIECSTGGFAIGTLTPPPGDLDATQRLSGYEEPSVILDFRQTGATRSVCGVNVTAGSWPNTAFIDAIRVVGKDAEDGCLITINAAFMENTLPSKALVSADNGASPVAVSSTTMPPDNRWSQDFITQGFYSYKICMKTDIFPHGVRLKPTGPDNTGEAYGLGRPLQLLRRLFEPSFLLQLGRYSTTNPAAPTDPLVSLRKESRASASQL